MKILIIKPSSLGDIVHALPFLTAVKDTFPGSEIDWVISSNLKGILEGNPLINRLITIDKDSWQNIKKLPQTISDILSLNKKLKSTHYDLVVDLQGLLRSGIITLMTDASIKVGFQDAREGSRYLYSKKVPVRGVIHAVDKCLEAAKAIGASVDKVSFPLYINEPSKRRAGDLIGNIDDYLVVIPSARWLTKRWPPEKFASLIMRVPVPAIIAGSKSDNDLAQKIIKYAAQGPEQPANNKIINLCGKTELQDLSALLEGARAVVTNDSGPMHIAAALNVPIVALFGPTDPEKTGPYGWQNKNHFVVIKADVPCRPCRNKKCDDFICMDSIKTETVYSSLSKFL